jgi:hypothetical protein
VASFLLEEGCHSAGFIATIHLRHHLLLSIGWRFSLFAPEEYRKYVIFQFGCQWGKFDSYKTVIRSENTENRGFVIPFESLRKRDAAKLGKNHRSLAKACPEAKPKDLNPRKAGSHHCPGGLYENQP